MKVDIERELEIARRNADAAMGQALKVQALAAAVDFICSEENQGVFDPGELMSLTLTLTEHARYLSGMLDSLFTDDSAEAA